MKADIKHPPYLSLALAFKMLVLTVLLTIMVAFLTSLASKAHAAAALNALSIAPRPHVVIQSDQIRLGDVFDGIQKHADFVLAPAPAPGEETIWNRPTLMRIATAFNLKWRPQNDTQVRITRAGHVIDSGTIRAVIRDHLTSETGHTLYDIRFANDDPSFAVSGDEAPMLSLADFSYQPHSGNFAAILRANMPDGTEHTFNLRGQADRQERIPVLRNPLRNGQLISARDIDYIVVRNATLRPGTVLDAQDIIGTTPRRQLSQNTAIRVDEIEMPRMISRGEIVTMVYAKDGMRLTTRGKALSDGALGDVIRVSNTGSNRMIEAKVTNFREVSVSH